MPKGTKAKHKTSSLAKAVTTNRHKQPPPTALGLCLDFRSAAATAEFTLEDASKTGKRMPTTSGMKSVLGSDSSLALNHRIRNATIPLGEPIEDDALVIEELSIERFDLSNAARRLMPRRPVWSYDLSSGRLHHREAQAFKHWLDEVWQLIAERGGYPPAFEQNLQVWRQLWRVLERCDVAVVVVDARHPLLHLPPALVHHVVRTLNKPLVVVLNKLDTVRPADAQQWAKCLESIPGVSRVVGHSKESLLDDFTPLPVGKDALVEACHGAVKVNKDSESSESVMLGLIGHPNVGKSSLVNQLVGGKVVSVKATPGHTKILQTMTLDERTCLCDSPGVIFPRLEVPREAQVIGMLIPLAQVREPFSALRWVMEHSSKPLNEMLHVKAVTMPRVLELQEGGTDTLTLNALITDEAVPWSPMLLCAQYATQRGLMNAGRPDCHRAGMEILERVLEGRLPYSVRPPQYLPNLARTQTENVEESDADSNWQLSDDYESEVEEEDHGNKGLFEHFDLEPKVAGSQSIQSRKKAARRQKLAVEAGEVPAKGFLQDDEETPVCAALT
mmetsp:Transcript_65182/g.172696  ORF Transcript_65182/g.172696 Transcript_65182/m.172696 type:complete len:559 (-) Transcript_65182:77-1753(-)|eukprot:CAMPEP_0194497368 /NCGR_PEP_ID=MMETSP0253-20130528/14327_1 /TAXON_ID=2966 /ORGANISM="Noctiluca scintillans" /LENGTH=558 /DNA_ID=CAMNT_0039338863 /DNA_START=14 /DNA_END=1690 /DNA_ORIENTATION=-